MDSAELVLSFVMLAFIVIIILALIVDYKRMLRKQRQWKRQLAMQEPIPDVFQFITYKRSPALIIFAILLSAVLAWNLTDNLYISIGIFLFLLLYILSPDLTWYTNAKLEKETFFLELGSSEVETIGLSDIRSARFQSIGGGRRKLVPNYTPGLFLDLYGKAPPLPIPMHIREYVLLKKYLEAHGIPIEDKYPQGLTCIISRFLSKFR